MNPTKPRLVLHAVSNYLDQKGYYFTIAAMEKLEALNTIIDEFHIKQTTTAIFGIADLIDKGKSYVEVSVPPTHLESGYLPDIVYDDDSQNDNFCSIFSEQLEVTQITQNDTTFEKLRSDNEILSSEFDIDPQEPILTSEAW